VQMRLVHFVMDLQNVDQTARFVSLRTRLIDCNPTAALICLLC
jgi:hypothetical protein